MASAHECDSREQCSLSNQKRRFESRAGCSIRQQNHQALGNIHDILIQLHDDFDFATIENLKNYCQQPWAAEGVEKAIKHYSVASKFVVAVTKNQDVWVNESWVNDILAKAQEVVAEHQKQWQQDGDEYVYGHGEGGFSESDPYKNHPWRFGNNQLELTTKIAKLLRNEDLQITSSGNGMKKKQERISVKNT